MAVTQIKSLAKRIRPEPGQESWQSGPSPSGIVSRSQDERAARHAVDRRL